MRPAPLAASSQFGLPRLVCAQDVQQRNKGGQNNRVVELSQGAFVLSVNPEAGFGILLARRSSYAGAWGSIWSHSRAIWTSALARK